MEADDAWGRSSSSSAAARRLQSRYDLYMGFDEAYAGGKEAEAYNCPFCGEDFDFVGLCCHIDDEHAVEANSGDRQTGMILGIGRRRKDRQGLYILDHLHLPSSQVAPTTSTSTATAATTSGVFA